MVACVACDPGKYSLLQGMRTCATCPAGRYSGPAAVECSLCPSNTYQDAEGSSQCNECPEGSVSDMASVRVEECRCAVGWFGKAGDKCELCPNPPPLTTEEEEEGYPPVQMWTQCPVEGLQWPLPLEGFWVNPEAPSSVIECSPSTACLNISVANEVLVSTGSTCALGYGEAACSACSEQFYRLEGGCRACPQNGIWFGIGLGVLAALFAPALFKLSEYIKQFASINIAIAFTQVTAYFAKFNLDWPPELQSFFEHLGFFNLNLELVHPECAIRWTFQTKWTLMMLMPLFIFGLLLAIVGAVVAHMAFTRTAGAAIRRAHPDVLEPPPPKGEPGYLKAKLRHKAGRLLCVSRNRAAFITFVQKCIRAMLTFLHLGYLFISGAAVEMFDCWKNRGDGRYYLHAEPTIECYVSSGVWADMFPWGVVAVLAYPVGILLLFAGLLWNAKGRLQEKAPENMIGFIYIRYRPSWYAFELVVMLRKCGIAVLRALFSDASVSSTRRQAVAGMFLLFFSLIFQLYARPYDSRRLDRMETFSVASQFFVLFSGLVFLADENDIKYGSKVGKMSPEFRILMRGLVMFVMCTAYIFMAIHIILDVFPKSYGKFKAKWRKKKEKKARRRQKMDRTESPSAGETRDGSSSMGIASIAMAMKFKDKAVMGESASRFLTLKGLRLAADVKNRPEVDMKLINKCLDELEVYTDDREGYWLGRKSGLPFEDCFRSASIVKVLAAMEQLPSEFNRAVVEFFTLLMAAGGGIISSRNNGDKIGELLEKLREVGGVLPAGQTNVAAVANEGRQSSGREVEESTSERNPVRSGSSTPFPEDIGDGSSAVLQVGARGLSTSPPAFWRSPQRHS
mmetsp:Transcript_42067/g.134383  ORF Transcript_42067/g.134383 Transcript_42067/m.134383 type:complete len:851 (+) Transcript_42067:208-2760(+)